MNAGSVPVGPVSGSLSVISLADVWTLITGKRDVVDRPKLDWTEYSGKSGRVELVLSSGRRVFTSCVSSIISYNSLDISLE
jgi:hypothetical protein